MDSGIIAISDYCDLVPPNPSAFDQSFLRKGWNDLPASAASPASDVTGGYLERLPMACVAAGLATRAEVWRFAGTDTGRDISGQEIPSGLTIRALRADGHAAPYGSADALAAIQVRGAPAILCVWGLGVTEDILEACANSVKIYNSIDAPALRIPPEISRHFDIFLTGAEWQSREIGARHPGALCAVLPIGPEFASDKTFFPTGALKDYDVVYVAAAQEYKRHDLLLEALSQAPGLRALCVVGYGHLTERLKAEAKRRGLAVDWIGPVDHDEVNRLINRARIGVVCGVDDGAPAILTEYMLAGLPVLANSGLVCGQQYIRPDTGLIASEAEFATAMKRLVETAHLYSPRPVVQQHWTWPHSVRRLGTLIEQAKMRKKVSA